MFFPNNLFIFTFSLVKYRLFQTFRLTLPRIVAFDSKKKMHEIGFSMEENDHEKTRSFDVKLEVKMLNMNYNKITYKKNNKKWKIRLWSLRRLVKVY